ncbi:MAG: AraC family transcriptional regulator [Rivularia sp. (in: cyanobacteria)]|jgi:AraC-like DNA-binding protein
MIKHLVLKKSQNWLIPGDTNDTRLFHSDASDCVRVCPPHLGQGYIQEITLREDLLLRIIDYTLNSDLLIDAPGESNCLEFEFQLTGRKAGYSFFSPELGMRNFWINLSKKRILKIEVIFKPPSLSKYFNKFIERLSPPLQQLSQEIIQSIHQYYIGKRITSTAALDRIVNCTVPSTQLSFEQIVSAPLYTSFTSIDCARRSPITPEMYEIIEQILSCPYRGLNRRRYLECKALELVNLRLDYLIQPQFNCLKSDDLIAIYQAEEILRTHLENPPSIQLLSRWVGLNRLKLNQGFHQVYHTTPFGYLRKCRLAKARRLLITSELPIEQVASKVGYTSRSRFATAFRQDFGINPKMFQVQSLNRAS